MKKTLKDCGVTASITVHRDGTATLSWCAPGGKQHKSTHKSEKAAYAKWRRMCA